MSESLTMALLLTVSGGFMDAYSYLCRGHVFANAQTGNILLLGVNLSTGDWAKALQYFCPVAAFMLGIAMADLTRHFFRQVSWLHWRQLAALAEAAILLAVMAIPLSHNLLANSLTSLACGAQVESFRKVRGLGAATTMCIGNLRTATQSVCDYCFARNKSDIRRGLLFFGMILAFVAGAVLGNLAVTHLGQYAIAGSAALLLAAFGLMFVPGRGEEVRGDKKM